jgi:hypothetical protein
MNKRSFLIICICVLTIQSKAQSFKIDTVAISILDQMSAMIGSLGSCSVTVKSNYDVNSQHLGLIKHSNEEQVYLQGPDKLFINSKGDRGSHSFYYDGKTLSYYSLEKNQYAEIEAPATTMAMIDTVNRAYGIDFPAADFLYPTFVDDILAEADNLAYLGITEIDGKECFHIAGTAKDKTFQFWISNDPFYLPVKVVIIYTQKEKNPQYEAILSNWQINPTFPDALFEFKIPPNAQKIKMIPVRTKK